MSLKYQHLGAFLAIAVMLTAMPSFGEDRCSGVAVTEVRSLNELPNALRRLLPDATGLGGIADRGGRYNSTDFIDRDLPMQRFVLAAVGTTCAVIAIEHGGFTHGFALAEYRITDAGWSPIGRVAVTDEPKSTKDLLTP